MIVKTSLCCKTMACRQIQRDRQLSCASTLSAADLRKSTWRYFTCLHVPRSHGPETTVRPTLQQQHSCGVQTYGMLLVGTGCSDTQHLEDGPGHTTRPKQMPPAYRSTLPNRSSVPAKEHNPQRLPLGICLPSGEDDELETTCKIHGLLKSQSKF